ncbi:NUDIX hydrolase [Jiulongibacter sp. NS-SX5]|uniref:NUDIX hydrolase n=1 Tax=Jiulongibacter sp. NS-SX5 TaxID=3463854 RepID=UPI004058E93F
MDIKGFIPQLSIDCVIFGYKNKELKVLVSKLSLPKELFSLPGGFISQDEDIDQAALRILKERTSLKDIYLEQFKVFGAAGRKNNAILDFIEEYKEPVLLGEMELDYDWFFKRFVTIGYYALVDINKVKPQKTILDDHVDWYPIDDLPPFFMDHTQIVEDALVELRRNLDDKLIGFNLLPETFTMRELQELYEAVYDKPFARNNFQKRMLSLGVLERLEKKFTGAANKAPYLYRFIS